MACSAGVRVCLYCMCRVCVRRVRLVVPVGALVNLTVGAASIFHKKPTDSLTEHIYYQSIRQRLSGTHIKHTRMHTHTQAVEVFKAEGKSLKVKEGKQQEDSRKGSVVKKEKHRKVHRHFKIKTCD